MQPINLKGVFINKITNEEFLNFCRENDDLLIERTSNRQIIISDPVPVDQSKRIQAVLTQLYKWNREHKMGTCITDQAFLLPNNAIRKPIFAWIKNDISEMQDNSQVIGKCPDFVLEVKRKGEDLKVSKTKMREWIANGCSLAWLIDEPREIIYSFEKNKTRMQIGFDKKMSGDPILQGFELDLASPQPPLPTPRNTPTF